MSNLPPGYIDESIQGDDRKLLKIFYEACLSEGGNTDEVNLRGIKAVLAQMVPVALRAVVQQIDHSWDGAERLKPVHVSAEPWKREGWCDAEGRCWWGRAGNEYYNPDWLYYSLEELEDIDRFCPPICVSLPHWAITIPT